MTTRDFKDKHGNRVSARTDFPNHLFGVRIGTDGDWVKPEQAHALAVLCDRAWTWLKKTLEEEAKEPSVA